jgi:hypothetical protein
MQSSRQGACVFPFLARRFPVPLQCSPDGFPILRRRFHHHFLNLLFEKPFGKRAQLSRATAKQPPLELVLTVDFDIRHNHCQHLFMDIDSSYPVRHAFLLAGAESVPEVALTMLSMNLA